MKKRDIDILFDIINNQQKNSIYSLSKKYGVTQRTIRNHLKTINYILRHNQLPKLCIENSGLIAYLGNKKSVIDVIKNDNLYNYVLSKSERQITITLMLLIAVDYTTIETVSNKLFVSRTTTNDDLSNVKKYVKSKNLKVESLPNKGMRILGRELDKRRCILDIILNKIGLSEINSAEYNPFCSMILFLINPNESDSDFIEQVIKTEERKNNLHLTDTSFLSLLYYLIIASYRIKAGEYVEDSGNNANRKFETAKELLAYIMDYFKLPLKNSEVKLLSEILTELGSVHSRNSDNNIVEIQIIANEFIHEISNELNCDLTCDYTFYENLEKHLQSTLKNSFAVVPQNSIKDIINKKYPNVQKITKNHISILKKFRNRPIDENEISYISMHVCAAIERKKNSTKYAKVIVVCGGGVGTSKLLAEQLKRRFNFEIIAVVAAHNADTLKDAKVDLVISTVPLKNFSKKYIKVNPFLNDEDYLKICKFLDNIQRNKEITNLSEKYSSHELLKAISPILDKYLCENEENKNFKKEIYYTVKKYFGETDDKTRCLYQFLTPDKIQLNVACSDYKEAIKKSAYILLKQGYVQERYIDAIYKNMKENGPYFVISKGFAVPHAEIGSGSLRTGMSLIRLKTPVYFGIEEFDPVEFVCCLSAVDSDSHLKAFFNLVNMLRNNDFKKQLKNSHSADDVVRAIKEYEYSI